MEFIDKIGTGNYRECYATEDPDLCVKKLKDSMSCFKIKIHNLLSATKIEELNKVEFNIIKNLPEELREYAPEKLSMHNNYLFMERPRDFDGRYSETVQENGKIKNDYFWKCVDEIATIFEENSLWFLDIFYGGNNLLVQKTSEHIFKPKIIDFKRLGRSMYPLQPNLVFKSEQKKKFHRGLKRFKDTYSE